MGIGYKNIAIKVLKISGITIGAVLLLLFLIPLLFPGQIAEEVKAFATVCTMAGKNKGEWKNGCNADVDREIARPRMLNQIWLLP